MQDESLAEWWAVAADMRRGGIDRILVPEPWSPTIDSLTDAGINGVAYAHELVTLPVGNARDFLDALREIGVPAIEDARAARDRRVPCRDDERLRSHRALGDPRLGDLGRLRAGVGRRRAVGAGERTSSGSAPTSAER